MSRENERERISRAERHMRAGGGKNDVRKSVLASGGEKLYFNRKVADKFFHRLKIGFERREEFVIYFANGRTYCFNPVT